MSNCLSQDQLERLVTDQLAEQEQSRAAAHVEECSECQRALQMITTGCETTGRPESDTTADDRVARLFEHLKAQRPLLCPIGLHVDFPAGQNGRLSNSESWENDDRPAGEAAAIHPGSTPTIDGFRIIREIG
jgi:hypothetical protein